MAKDAKNNKDVKKKRFFKDFKAELKKVIWPTPKQVVNNTIAVITIVLITAAIVFVLDLVFDLFNEYGINKLKSNIRNKIVVENTIDTSTENTTTDVTSAENDEQQENNQENTEQNQENVQ